MGNPRVDSELRAAVRGSYDLQKLRISMGNRICAEWKSKRNMKPSKPEEDTMKKVDLNLLKRLKNEYKRVTDGIVGLPKEKKFEGTELIGSFVELVLIDQYMRFLKVEKESFKRFIPLCRKYGFYNDWLIKQHGVGPRMASVILTEIDIYKAATVSSLWKYCGLDCAEDGQRRSKRKEHLIEVEYTDRDGNKKKKLSITYNPYLKAKMMAGLAPSMIRLKTPRYKQIYDDFKLRMQNHEKYGMHMDKVKRPNGKGFMSSGLRREMQARGYMIKQFFIELYSAWKDYENLPKKLPYHEAKLGMKHTSEPPSEPEDETVDMIDLPDDDVEVDGEDQYNGKEEAA